MFKYYKNINTLKFNGGSVLKPRNNPNRDSVLKSHNNPKRGYFV